MNCMLQFYILETVVYHFKYNEEITGIWVHIEETKGVKKSGKIILFLN